MATSFTNYRPTHIRSRATKRRRGQGSTPGIYNSYGSIYMPYQVPGVNVAVFLYRSCPSRVRRTWNYLVKYCHVYGQRVVVRCFFGQEFGWMGLPLAVGGGNVRGKGRWQCFGCWIHRFTPFRGLDILFFHHVFGYRPSRYTLHVVRWQMKR